MDTPRSGFVPALEYFWNSWASGRRDIVLIVCGSATSWMMDKLINNHGGLHNRLTCRIFLRPFTLAECEQFFISRDFHLSRYDIALWYMVMGGTPFYLDMLMPHLSLAQNIDSLFFNRYGAMCNEFKNLYAALFKNSADYITVVKALSGRSEGLTRDEIIRTYRVYAGIRGANEIYQLTDFYTLFHFHFLERGDVKSWLALQGKPKFYAWAGLAFERLALCHIDEVKRKLGISGIETQEYAWRCNDEAGGAQIDMVIDRADHTVNICEMKFSIAPYVVTQSYEMNLRNKVERYMEQSKRRKSAQLTLITTFGLAEGKRSGIAQQVITLDDFFLG